MRVLISAPLAVALVAAGCGGSDGDGCGTNGPTGNVTMATLELTATSTGTLLAVDHKCATPLLEQQVMGQWQTVATVAPFTCGCGVEVCPGPIPTPLSYKAVTSTPTAHVFTLWNYGEGADVAPGRYRVTVPYCTDKQACDEFTVTGPESRICPSQHTEVVEFDITGSGLVTIPVVLEP